MQKDLGIDTVSWGWLTGIFGLAYCIFEIPSGTLGTHWLAEGAARIVIWWSAFTALTGAMTRFYPLLIVRFLFGAGEAGAFPNGFAVICGGSRHPSVQHARRGRCRRNWEADVAAVGSPDPDALWIAGVLFLIRPTGCHLGGGLVYVVSRFAGRSSA